MITDKQTTALVLFAIVAFVFYLNNTGRLGRTLDAIKGTPAGSGLPPVGAGSGPLPAPDGTIIPGTGGIRYRREPSPTAYDPNGMIQPTLINNFGFADMEALTRLSV